MVTVDRIAVSIYEVILVDFDKYRIEQACIIQNKITKNWGSYNTKVAGQPLLFQIYL